MKEKKKQSPLGVLLDYAGAYRRLTYLGLALSAVAMVLGMAPYICIWLAARDLIAVAPDWTRAAGVAMVDYLMPGDWNGPQKDSYENYREYIYELYRSFEPGVTETAPGVLYGWARTDLGRQYEFRSADGGVHWTDAVPSRFTSPLSPLSMKGLTDGRLMAVWNPVPRNNLSPDGDAADGRTPLVFALSGDGGASWSAPRVIEDDPRAGYCYTAILPLRDAVLLAYCAGTEEDGCCLNRLRIRRMACP